MVTVRAIELTRLAWGGALLLSPGWTLKTIHRIQVDRESVLIAQVLGARQISQAVLSGTNPSPEVLAMGVWVDVAHAASALGLAGVDRQRAPAGLTDAAVAVAWAGLGWRDLRRGPVPAPAHDRRREEMARWVLAHVPGGEPLTRRAQTRRGGVGAIASSRPGR